MLRKTGNAGRHRNERLLRQADAFDTRGTDRRRRLMTALDAINRRVGRDSDFYAGAGVHRDRKAFAAPVVFFFQLQEGHPRTSLRVTFAISKNSV